MNRKNHLLAILAAVSFILATLTGCGGKVTERAMEKAYGDFLRGQMGKPDLKVTYDVSPAVFEKIDGTYGQTRQNGSTELIWPATIRTSISTTEVISVMALPC